MSAARLNKSQKCHLKRQQMRLYFIFLRKLWLDISSELSAQQINLKMWNLIFYTKISEPSNIVAVDVLWASSTHENTWESAGTIINLLYNCGKGECTYYISKRLIFLRHITRISKLLFKVDTWVAFDIIKLITPDKWCIWKIFSLFLQKKPKKLHCGYS